jgi:hypothetical protein
MTPFGTDDLTQAAFLWCQGHEPTRTERTGTFVTFIFETLDAREAAAMLGGPEHSLCKRYSHAWRALRRMADEATRNGGRR